MGFLIHWYESAMDRDGQHMFALLSYLKIKIIAQYKYHNAMFSSFKKRIKKWFSKCYKEPSCIDRFVSSGKIYKLGN